VEPGCWCWAHSPSPQSSTVQNTSSSDCVSAGVKVKAKRTGTPFQGPEIRPKAFQGPKKHFSWPERTFHGQFECVQSSIQRSNMIIQYSTTPTSTGKKSSMNSVNFFPSPTKNYSGPLLDMIGRPLSTTCTGVVDHSKRNASQVINNFRWSIWWQPQLRVRRKPNDLRWNNPHLWKQNSLVIQCIAATESSPGQKRARNAQSFRIDLSIFYQYQRVLQVTSPHALFLFSHRQPGTIYLNIFAL